MRKPIHPTLGAFPIALWLFSFFCDIIHGLGWGGHVWKEVAYYALSAGIVMGIIAVAAAFRDYLALEEPRWRKIGRAYLSLQLIALVLYLYNFAARHGNADYTVLPIILSFVGVVLIVISGWLGAELVHEYHSRQQAMEKP